MPRSKHISLIEFTGQIAEVFWAKFAKLEALYGDNKELRVENKDLRM